MSQDFVRGMIKTSSAIEMAIRAPKTVWSAGRWGYPFATPGKTKGEGMKRMRFTEDMNPIEKQSGFLANSARTALRGIGAVGETSAKGLKRILWKTDKVTGKKRLGGKRLLATGAGGYLGLRSMKAMSDRQSKASPSSYNVGRNVYNEPNTMMRV